MLLDRISTGTIDKPPRLLVYGVPGVGKSTFASGAPDVLFLDAEKRTEHLNINRLDINSWSDAINAMKELLALANKNESPYKTLVFDTLDHLELLLFKHLCATEGVNSIEDYGGGWGKGYVAALEKWEVFNLGLEQLRNAGYTCVLLAHSQIRLFNNPEGENYDKYMLKLHQKAANFLIAEMDYVGFACFEDLAKVEKYKKTKGVTTGERILKFGHSAAYDSKAGRPIADVVPLEWEAFSNSISKDKNNG